MNEKMRDQAILEEMQTRYACPEIGRATREANLDDWGIPRQAGNLLLSDPNAFLYGSLMNFMIGYTKALSAPLELNRRLGHLDVRRLAEMNPEQLSLFVAGSESGPSLHRFPNKVAGRLVGGSAKLVAEYGGSGSNVWPNGTRAGTVAQRLDDFVGISQKLSHWMVNKLVTSFGIELTHWRDIDVAVDRHVARFFLRTGLVPRADGEYRVTAVATDVIHTARRVFPEFPGYLDCPAFEIGSRWCTAKTAYCDGMGGGEPCPLRATCRRRTEVHVRESQTAKLSLPCCP